MLSCSFTGHREIKKEHVEHLPGFIARAIEYAYSKGCRRFMTGGALGFDTFAAREIIKFRMTHPDTLLVLVLPCENQSDRWNSRQRSSYDYTVSEADEVIYIEREYTPLCMKKRNKYIADRADIMISYISKEYSGAAQTVRMASGSCEEIYNLYPAIDKMLAAR